MFLGMVFYILVGSDYTDGKKLIEMSNNKFAFLTDYGDTVRVVKEKEAPTSADDRNVAKIRNKQGMGYLIQFGTGRFLCAKPDDPGVVSCDEESDKNTLWAIEENGKGALSLKNKNGKCLIIASFDKRAGSKGLRVNMGDCQSKLDSGWHIKNFKGEEESESDVGESYQSSKYSRSYSKSVRTSRTYRQSIRRKMIQQIAPQLITTKKIKTTDDKVILPSNTTSYTIHLWFYSEKPTIFCTKTVPLNITGPTTYLTTMKTVQAEPITYVSTTSIPVQVQKIYRVQTETIQPLIMNKVQPIVERYKHYEVQPYASVMVKRKPSEPVKQEPIAERILPIQPHTHHLHLDKHPEKPSNVVDIPFSLPLS